MEEDECIHGLATGTCRSCSSRFVERRASPSDRSGAIWEKYRERYATRPETFDAYIDVWRRSSTAQAFVGGWTAFSKAANAEPAVDPASVSHAEEIMRQFGYESEAKVPGVGRRWHRASDLAR